MEVLHAVFVLVCPCRGDNGLLRFAEYVALAGTGDTPLFKYVAEHYCSTRCADGRGLAMLPTDPCSEDFFCSSSHATNHMVSYDTRETQTGGAVSRSFLEERCTSGNDV